MLISSCPFEVPLRRDWLFLTNTAGNTGICHANFSELETHRQCPILQMKMSNLGFHIGFTVVIAQQHLLLRNFTVISLQVSRYYFPYWTAMNALVHHQPSFSFWIKAKLVQLYYAINTYSKNKIPYIPQSENYEITLLLEDFWSWHIQNMHHYKKAFSHANEMYGQMTCMDLNRYLIIKRLKNKQTNNINLKPCTLLCLVPGQNWNIW